MCNARRPLHNAYPLSTFVAALAFIGLCTFRQGSAYAQHSQIPPPNTTVRALLLTYVGCAASTAGRALSSGVVVFDEQLKKIEPHASLDKKHPPDVSIAMHMAYSSCAHAYGHYLAASLAAQKALAEAEEHSKEPSLSSRYEFNYFVFTKRLKGDRPLNEWVEFFQKSMPSLQKLAEHSQTIKATFDADGKVKNVLVDGIPVPSGLNNLFTDKYPRLKEGATYQVKLTDDRTEAEQRKRIEGEHQSQLDKVRLDLTNQINNSEKESADLRQKISNLTNEITVLKKTDEANRKKGSTIFWEFNAGGGFAINFLADQWTLDKSTPSLPECPENVSCTYAGENPGGRVDGTVYINLSVGARFRESNWALGAGLSGGINSTPWPPGSLIGDVHVAWYFSKQAGRLLWGVSAGYMRSEWSPEESTVYVRLPLTDDVKDVGKASFYRDLFGAGPHFEFSLRFYKLLVGGIRTTWILGMDDNRDFGLGLQGYAFVGIAPHRAD